MVWLCRRAFAGYTGTLYALVLLSGCGSGTEPNGPANITLNPPSLSFNAIGQTQQLSATVTDPQGNPITAAVTWTTSDVAVVSVSSSGAVTAAGSGSAEVTATAGSVHAVAEVAVSQTPTQMEKTQGDGQTVVAGQPVPTPPTVLVTDANHNPVPGVDVTFQVTSGRGQVTPAVVATDNSGIAQVGGWSPGSKGSNVLTATAAGAGISGNPVTFTATGTSAFDIEVQFLGSATTSQRQAFTDAAERWETLVTGDVENIPLQTQAGDCGEGSPALNQTIDDLLIFVTLEHIDGPGGVLGSAGPCFIRNSNNLSVAGAMIFDNQDLADIEDAGLLQALILHEMGHVLGFGSLWPTMNLLADPSLPPGTGIDPHFTGAQAIAAFNQVGGTAYTGAKVPVENTGGEGTADGHWRESVFINELMTGFVDLGENPLSVVTVSSLADQGYVVNKVGADPFSLTLSLRALGQRHRFQLGNDVLRIPIRKVDRAGRVTGYFRR